SGGILRHQQLHAHQCVAGADVPGTVGIPDRKVMCAVQKAHAIRGAENQTGTHQDGGIVSEYERWEGRFAVPDYVFGTAPNAFLASCRGLLPRTGNALAVADGEGRNGVWLAEQGLDVLSIDFSPSAQQKARALAKERGVKVAFERADVHTWTYPE